MSHYSFVLVVDDDPDMRQMVSRVLRGMACVVEVPDAEAARHVAGQLLFDIIISDQEMPGETGLSLLRHFREVAPATRRVLMTGADLDLDRLVGTGLLDAAVSKPWNVLTLRHLVQRLLEPAGQPAWPARWQWTSP